MALKETTKEAIFLNNILTSINNLLRFNYNITIPSIITDSQSAQYLAENPEFHKRTKHIDITYHFVRWNIMNKKVLLTYTKSNKNIADGLTKGLNTTQYRQFILNI